MKTAILAASFGTTHPEAIRKDIQAVEDAIAAACFPVPVYRAFTSAVVRRILHKRHGLNVPGLADALSQMRADGISHAVVQPTLIFRGSEYAQLQHALAGCADMRIETGAPLIETAADLEAVLSAMQAALPRDADTCLLAVAHGSHEPCCPLPSLATQLHSPVMLCAMEGEPSFQHALDALKRQPRRRLCLLPLLLVSGTHARREIAGDGPASLHSRLTDAGFEVTWQDSGLGALPDVQAMYVRRVRQAFERLMNSSAPDLPPFPYHNQEVSI